MGPDLEKRRGSLRIDRPLAVFFLIAYGLAWGIWAVMARLADSAGMDSVDFLKAVEAGNFASFTSDTPNWLLYLLTRIQDFSFTIAGLIMISVTGGRDGWRRLGSRLTMWRISPSWYALGLLPVALYGVAAALASPGGDYIISPSTIRAVLFSLSAGLLVSLFLRGAFGEEIGLRGFALPRLQQSTTPTRASLIIGILWALWHIPVLLDKELVVMVVLLALIVGLSFIFTWLFNGSGGSLIPPLLFHATQNWEEGWETIRPDIIGTNWETPATLALLPIALVAATLIRHSSTHVTEIADIPETSISADV